MEGPDIEFWTEDLLGARAELDDFELSDFVAQCLAGPGDVTVDLGLDVGVVHRGVRAEIVEHLLARPVHGMDAGIDDEADGAPGIGLESSVVGPGVLVKADVLAEALGIESPAFGVGGVVNVLAEVRKSGELLRDGDLQVMAGNAFVIANRFNVS